MVAAVGVSRRWHYTLGPFLPAGVAYLALTDRTAPAIFVAAAGLIFALFSLKDISHQWRDVARGLGVCALTLASLFLLGVLVLWQSHGLRALVRMYASLIGGGENAGTESPLPGLIPAYLSVPLVPLITLMVLGIISRVCRVPLSVGLARGARGLAVPIACSLLLAYGGLVLLTARHEAAASYRLERVVQHEGCYYAELVGQPWPGAPR